MCSLFTVAPHLLPSTPSAARTPKYQTAANEGEQPNARNLLTRWEVLVEGLAVSALLQAADIDSEETFGVNMNDRLRHLQRLGQQLFALRFHAFPQD